MNPGDTVTINQISAGGIIIAKMTSASDSDKFLVRWVDASNNLPEKWFYASELTAS